MFNPMWDNEVRRIAVQKCSPLAMRLYAYADLCSLLALIWLVLGWGALSLGGWWWSVILWVLGRVVYRCAYVRILQQHEFSYDADKITARWRDKSGAYHVYTHQDLLDEMEREN